MQIEISEAEIVLARNVHDAILSEDYFCNCPQELINEPELQVYKTITNAGITHTTARIRATLYLTAKLFNGKKQNLCNECRKD